MTGRRPSRVELYAAIRRDARTGMSERELQRRHRVSGGLLGGYVLVMVLPALLLVLRLAVGRRWDPALQRARDWVARSSAGTLSWGGGHPRGAPGPATPSPTSLRSSTASVAESDAPAAAATRCAEPVIHPRPLRSGRADRRAGLSGCTPPHNGTHVSGTFIPVT